MAHQEHRRHECDQAEFPDHAMYDTIPCILRRTDTFAKDTTDRTLPAGTAGISKGVVLKALGWLNDLSERYIFHPISCLLLSILDYFSRK